MSTLPAEEKHVETGPDEQVIGPHGASPNIPNYKSTVTQSADPKKPKPKYEVGKKVSYTVMEDGKRKKKTFEVASYHELGGHFQYVIKDPKTGEYAEGGEYIDAVKLSFA
ncbi:MAG: hypothetical protein M1822_009326 [Bathelium mastoideum]|nr:MAG: hypothetical protein M1822_009326 [Bathelium mastoideum]